VAVAGAVPAVAEHADLAVRTPGALLAAIDSARALRRRLRLLLGISAAGNAVGVGVAAAGLLDPVLAAVIMAGSSLLVTLLAAPGAPDAS
jgi:Cu2+-exporting ATPase